MSTDENKYTFELCKRRGIKAKLHPIVTDFKLLKVMTVKKNTEARSKATRQKFREVPLKGLGDEYIQQHALYPNQNYTYEQSLQRYRNFFMTRPLMRCLESDENVDEKLGNELLTRLREEVRRMPPSKPARPGKQITCDDYRGELQSRAFWDNVRLQLQTDEDDNIDDSKSKNPFEEESTDKKITGHVKAKARGLRSLKLVTKVYGRRDDMRLSKWQGAIGTGSLHGISFRYNK
ncbi:00952d29-f726-44d3-9a75-3e3b8c339427 [Sclerotinia trifoliorum]|uniref:00952d29-f726-44d3-9a75-3e3b8c339427 n=1 Tax=Sclerotinia trifoliorum TaxID=28548 RepID=A0A8H2VQI8_9HELO|nr:00952d29-f726-44d3-9a75-3e3b8c339427 [Sclerotinia trifoliorum]